MKIGDHIKGMYFNSGDEYNVKRIIVSNIFKLSLNDSTYILKRFDTNKYSHYDQAYYDNILNKCRPGISFVHLNFRKFFNFNSDIIMISAPLI